MSKSSRSLVPYLNPLTLNEHARWSFIYDPNHQNFLMLTRTNLYRIQKTLPVSYIIGYSQSDLQLAFPTMNTCWTLATSSLAMIIGGCQWVQCVSWMPILSTRRLVWRPNIVICNTMWIRPTACWHSCSTNTPISIYYAKSAQPIHWQLNWQNVWKVIIIFSL